MVNIRIFTQINLLYCYPLDTHVETVNDSLCAYHMWKQTLCVLLYSTNPLHSQHIRLRIDFISKQYGIDGILGIVS